MSVRAPDAERRVSQPPTPVDIIRNNTQSKKSHFADCHRRAYVELKHAAKLPVRNRKNLRTYEEFSRTHLNKI